MSRDCIIEKEVISWMVSLADVAYLKWPQESADLLESAMNNFQPKELSARKLATMTRNVGFPVSHETINRMRRGRAIQVAPENLIGVCLALNIDLNRFFSAPSARINIPMTRTKK